MNAEFTEVFEIRKSTGEEFAGEMECGWVRFRLQRWGEESKEMWLHHLILRICTSNHRVLLLNRDDSWITYVVEQ